MKTRVTHEHMKVLLAELLEDLDELPSSLSEDDTEILEEFEEKSGDVMEKFAVELLFSSLIIAGDVSGGKINLTLADIDGEKYALLFTDMDEFRKVFPRYEVGSNVNNFGYFLNMMKNTEVDGIIINFATECFILPEDSFRVDSTLPEYEYSLEDSYTSGELKRLKDEINNRDLEEFIENPKNIGKYEDLFEKIASSTVLTLMLSEDNLSSMAEDGIISMEEDDPLGFIHIERVGGKYATVFTSEEKISGVHTSYNRYSQIVHFPQISHFSLNLDLDGIIINPNTDNIVLTRDVLLKYSEVIETTCMDSRLNSAIFHMFPIEGEA